MSRPALNLPTTISTDDEHEYDAGYHGGGGVVAELVGGDLSTPVTVEQVPAPYDPHGDQVLDSRERADLATCEQAVAGLQRALAVAGKALATINRARLYRETHPTFEAYVEDRWGMKRAHAYRLIEAWPVAAALSPIGDTNEAQVRELLPAAKRHGIEAAVGVYAELRDQGGRITATRIREAVRVLPPRLVAPEQARDVIRAATAAGRLSPPLPRQPTSDPDDGEVVDAELVEEEDQDVADHQAAEAVNRNLRKAAEAAEEAQRHLEAAETAVAAGVRPLNLGAAIHDRSRLRRARNALHRGLQ